MSSDWGSSLRKPDCREFLGVQCHQIEAAAIENPIARTISGSHVIRLWWRPSKTPLAEPSWGPMSSDWGSGLRKPHCWDFLGVQCHRIEAAAIENPSASTFSGPHVIRLWWQTSRTPMLGLSWGPMSSIRGSGHLKPRSRDLLWVACHQIGAAALENPIDRTFFGSSIIESRQRPSKKTPFPGTILGSHVIRLWLWPSKTPVVGLC